MLALPVKAANECGPIPSTGSPPEVVCDASDDDAQKTVFKPDATGKYRAAIIQYDIHKPKKNRSRRGLKITLNDDIEILPSYGPSGTIPSLYGLAVYATRNAPDGIVIESSADNTGDDTFIGGAGAAHSAILVSTDGDGITVPITINVRKGVLGTYDSDYSAGPGQADSRAGVILVNDRGNDGDITVNFAAEIRNAVVHGAQNDGIRIYRDDAQGGDVAVTLEAGSRIASIINDGVHIHDDLATVAPSNIQVTVAKGATVGTADDPVKMVGIHVWVQGNEQVASKKVTIMNDGAIYATGHGIYVSHTADPDASPGTNYGGGEVSVTIGKSGLVMAGKGKDGVYINTPTTQTITEGGRRAQEVTVEGEIKGGEDAAAIHLMGGGMVTVGKEGKLMPNAGGTSSRSVKVTSADTPADSKPNLLIKLDQNFMGLKDMENAGKTAFEYRTAADGVYAVLADGTKIEGVELTSLPCGIYSNCSGKETLTAEITDKDNNVFSLNFKSEITELAPPAAGQETVHMRGRVYEALPSVMWDMVGAMGTTYMPSMMSGGTASASGPLQFAQNGTMAAADPGMMADRRAWGSIEAGDGERRLQKSMSGNLSYDFSYSGFATGVDLPAVNDMMFRVGLHHRQGKADVTDGGRVKVSGTGVGVGMARQYSDGLMVDGWLGVTKYDDIEVRSSEMVNGQLIDVNQKTEGVGYAIGLGASKRMGFGNLSLTQRGGLTWTSISVDDYVVSYTSMDESATRGTVAQPTKDPVSMESSSGVTGRYGVLFEGEIGKTSEACCKLFSSLDLEHDFSVERSVKVGNYDYKSESKPTRLRLGIGGSQFWNDDRSSVSGAIYLTSAGSGNNTVSGGVALSVEF